MPKNHSEISWPYELIRSQILSDMLILLENCFPTYLSYNEVKYFVNVSRLSNSLVFIRCLGGN